MGISNVWMVFKAVSLEEACLGPRVDREELGPGIRSVRWGEKRKTQQWGLTGTRASSSVTSKDKGGED